MLTAVNCQEELINNTTFSFVGKDIALANSLMHFHKQHYKPQIFHIESRPVVINVDIVFNTTSCIQGWLMYYLNLTPDADDQKTALQANKASDLTPKSTWNLTGGTIASYSQELLEDLKTKALKQARYIHNLFILEHVINLLLAGNDDMPPLLQNYQVKPVFTPAPSMIRLFLLKTERIKGLC